MPKNFFRKIKESMMPTNTGGGRDDKSHDFERAKDVLFSAKNLEQLVSAVKYINNFNKKHKIRETSPEFIYFDKMINVMKIKLRSRKKEVGNDSEDSERMDLRGRIRESLDDMDWIKDTQPTKLDFNFDEKEYWVDVSKIDIEGREKIVDYIKKTVPNFREFGGNELQDITNWNSKGLIIHCGSDETDFEPKQNLICYSTSSYEDDYEIDNPYADISKSIYIDGQEILDYLSVIGDEEELEESLEWTDKDVPFDEKDKSFEADPTWSNDEDWAPNPDRSYWKQGDAGGSGGGDVNESEEDPFKWIKDVKPIKLIVWTDANKKKKTIDLDAGQLKMAVSSGHDNDFNWNIDKIKQHLNRGDREGTTDIDRYHGGGSDTVYWELSESEEDPFKWMKDVEPDELSASPDVFFRSDDEMYYTLDQLGYDITNMSEFTMCELAQNEGYRWSEKWEGWYHRDEVSDFRNLNESQDLNWIKDVSSKLPSINDRTKIDLKDFLMDFMEDGSSEVLEVLYDDGQYEATDEYHNLYTPPAWRQEGEDNWLEGDWKEHGEWNGDPWVGSYDILEELERGCDSWEFIDRKTDDYDLEHGSWDDLYIFKRKRDGRFFALAASGNYHDGFDDHSQYLYEVFPQMKLVYESEGEWDWAKEIPGTKEYGEKYRYFEVVACYGFDYETEECDDEYSHFVKIPKHEADVIWDGSVGYFGGPGDEALGVIEYVIENQLISRHELEEIVAFEGVREISEEEMEEADEMDIEFVDEGKNINESDWDWLEGTKEHANYNGHPQGIVKIYDHDEIDRIVDIIDNYNGFPSTTDRINIHQGLEDRRDELEAFSEDGEDYGEAVLSVSFFVEKERRGFGPNALTLGYWPYEVDEGGINEWLGHKLTYNKEYELYEDIEQVEQAFKQFQN